MSATQPSMSGMGSAKIGNQVNKTAAFDTSYMQSKLDNLKNMSFINGKKVDQPKVQENVTFSIENAAGNAINEIKENF